MRIADGQRFPFQVRKNGKIVAYALDLSRPNKKQRNFFGKVFKNHRFGTAPTARLAVIKQNAAEAQEVQARCARARR